MEKCVADSFVSE